MQRASGFNSYQVLWLGLICFFIFSIAFSLLTVQSLKPVSGILQKDLQAAAKSTFYDRNGQAINVTYQSKWNTTDWVSLDNIPKFLQQSFILAEDKRFYQHHGPDWLARLQAIKQNILAGRIVRGASTITEQVVRMINLRPRTFWSRWLEGFEAIDLEQRYSKAQILAFYLNQTPYLAQRRGVQQAARYYFNRDLNTLNQKEMLALACMLRSPRWLNPQQYPVRLDQAITQLAKKFPTHLHINNELKRQTLSQPKTVSSVDASHFIQYAKRHLPAESLKVFSSLDLTLQNKAQLILDNQLRQLAVKQVHNGAIIIADHLDNKILAWVVGYAGQKDRTGNKINAAISLRQPGSTLKPLLYALALEKGWTAATQINDAPLTEQVGFGLHSYRNYSHRYYGPVSLRTALANSLNIPAIKTVQFVGMNEFLAFLKKTGITDLNAHPHVYGDGLALGNGEISLLELVQAYTVLARMGSFQKLSFLAKNENAAQPVMSSETASIIADILSDPHARSKEFGHHSILNFPQQTAVKTGTSTDYRDAWAIGFNDRYTIGVWIGNMDYQAMNKVTGASGAVLPLRAIFNELNKNRDSQALRLSPNLIKKTVCAKEDCLPYDEWFKMDDPVETAKQIPQPVTIRQPSHHLQLAMDPRIPDDKEYFEFTLNHWQNIQRVNWFLNDQLIAKTSVPFYRWLMAKGEFNLYARVELAEQEDRRTPRVNFQVN